MLQFCTYTINKAPEGFPPKLEVKIQMFGEWGLGPNGEKLVTPSLISTEEVNYWISGIIKNLESVRLEARAKLEENG
jgi:hypothetical protein